MADRKLIHTRRWYLAVALAFFIIFLLAVTNATHATPGSFVEQPLVVGILDTPNDTPTPSPTCGPNGNDLVVASAYWRTACYQTPWLEITARLIGAGPVDPTTMRVQDPYSWVREFAVPALSNNGSYTASISRSEIGSPPMTVTVDYNNVVLECNESNNTYIVTYIEPSHTHCPAYTFTRTRTPTVTVTGTPTNTPTVTLTVTGIPPTSTPTYTSTSTRSHTPTPISTGRTRLPTGTPTNTPTPDLCGSAANYSIVQSVATPIGGTVDTGNHCDNCVTTVGLPFLSNLYGLTVDQVNVNPNGALQYAGSIDSWEDRCLPSTATYYNLTVFPHRDDLRTDTGAGCASYTSGCGIYTSVVGAQGDRIFVIEWRAVYQNNPSQRANFEVRLHERSPGVGGVSAFDVFYNLIDQGGSGATVGVQRFPAQFTQYECSQSGSLTPGLLLAFSQLPCVTSTPTVTLTSTPSPTCGPDGNDLVPSVSFWHTQCYRTPWLEVTTRLIGAGPVGPTIMRLNDRYSWVHEVAVPSLSNNGSYTASFLNSEVGSPPITLTVDYYNVVTECNESNNAYVITYVEPSHTHCPSPTFTRTHTPTITPSSTRTNTPTRTPTPSVTGTLPTNTLIPTLTPAQPTQTPSPCVVTFTDVLPSDYFYTAVQRLYCSGVISGYADNTFRPYNATTRAQLCKIVVLAEGWTIYTPPNPTFSDVPPDNPFYAFVETAYRQNVITGYANGAFRPGNNVTRAQLCKIVVLAEEWELDCPQPAHFTDVPPTDPFYCYIETVYNRGVISGYTDGTFRPGNSATRGQICKIVYQAVIAP